MKTAIYKAQVTTPFGKGQYTIAVESTEHDAKIDIMSAALSEFKCHAGMLRVKDVTKSTKRIIAKMQPIKNAVSNDGFWAWIAI